MEADIANAISALSVLFGVAVFHLGASAAKISGALNQDVPEKTLKHARNHNRQNVRNALLLGALPNFLMLAAILFVMSPTMIDNIKSRNFSFFELDFMATLFQIIGFIVVFYAALSLINVVRLISKWVELW